MGLWTSVDIFRILWQLLHRINNTEKPLGRLLRLLTDGGSENWSEGFILLLGWLVGVDIFDAIEWTPFPPKHSRAAEKLG